MGSRPVRTIIMVFMDILIVVAVALTLRVVVMFFGQLASQSWGQAVIVLTQRLVIPFGVAAIKTPYGGRFDVNAALTIFAVLAVEWVLSSIRDRA
jgi:hypothetical protein